jgi:ribonuclease HII
MKAAAKITKIGPTFLNESALLRGGLRLVAGLDEVGRGPLAGPVAAAAVILSPKDIPDGLDDSKILDAACREDLFAEITARAIGIGIGFASAEEIDRVNIRQATFLAMQRACRALPASPDFVLVDGRDIPPKLPCPARAIIGGDALCASIAAASIVAKVVRDRLMARLAGCHPGYGFESHMGYATKAHRDAIRRLGPSPFHRRTFGLLKEI